jgi:hypothetical protein
LRKFATPAWLWPNLLSLDAPLVALVWQDLAARSLGGPIRLAARIVLGLTVWAIYLADRLLDIRAANPPPDTSRHAFCRRHPRALTALLAAVLTLDALIAVIDLRRTVFFHGLAVAGCVAAYLSAFPMRNSGWEKQVLAALLFSTGVLLATGTAAGLMPLVMPGALFAALCLCNLILIELSERNRQHRLMWLAPIAVAAIALARPASAWHDAIALSAVLLAALALSGSRLTDNARRVLADVALLTPLLFR